jgi:ABC-2 type transport system permease protein
MRNVFTLALRDLRAAFTTPLAYVVSAGFLLISAFFFFSLLKQFDVVLVQSAMVADSSPNLNEWVITPYFRTLEILLIFVVPFITMRTIAEERKNGTFELLSTSPLGTAEIVLGKYLAAASMVFVMVALSFIYPSMLILLANPEAAPAAVGGLGVLLLALSFTALGIAVSACSSSQTAAGSISVVLLLLFYLVQYIPAESAQYLLSKVLAAISSEASQASGGMMREFLLYLAPSSHTEALLKGVLTGADIVYFLSVTAFGIFAANRILEAERWK